MTTKWYKMAEAVAIVSHVTQIPQSLTRSRFRNWVTNKWLAGVVETTGRGRGLRRTYSRTGLLEACMMNLVAQYQEGPVLAFVAMRVRMNMKKFERAQKDTQQRLWLVVEDKAGRSPAFNVGILEGQRGADDTSALNLMERSDSLLLLNVGRIMARFKE